MKYTYSEYRGYHRNVAATAKKEGRPAPSYEELQARIERELFKNGDPRNSELTLYYTELAFMPKVTRHYFLEDPMLEQFFKDTAPKLTYETKEFICDLASIRRSKTRAELYRTMDGTRVEMGGFFLHFPRSGFDSMLVLAGSRTLSVFRDGACIWLTRPREGGCYNCAHGGRHEECVAKFNNSGDGRLLAGFLAYIQCFPEAVKDGLPVCVNHPNHFRKMDNCGIGATEEVKRAASEDAGHSVKPHFRCSHFRILRSARYTHKQWQSIFVKGCFINGEVKMVDNIDNIDEKGKVA